MQKRIVMAVLLAAGIAGTCHFSNGNIQTVPYTAYAAAKGTITGSNLRVRTGAGTDKEALTCDGKEVLLSKGTKVTVKKAIEVKDVTWYQVSFTYSGKSLNGYVSGDYVNITEETADTNSKDDTSSTTSSTTSANINAPAKLTATNVNVRKTASTKGAKVGTLTKGASVKVLKEKKADGKKWYYISYTENKKTKKGYVLSDYITLTFSKNMAGTIDVSSKVILRKGAGSDKPYLKAGSTNLSLKNKAAVVITKEAKDAKGIKWFQVSFYYKNKMYTGYVKAAYVKLSKVVTVTGQVSGTDNLNVRVAAGTDQKQLTYKNVNVKLKKGTQINILGQKEVKGTIWYRGTFTYEKKSLTGFVSSDYIEITKTTGVPKAIIEAADGSAGTKPDQNTPEENKPEENKPEETDKPGGTEPGEEEQPEDSGPLSSAEFETYMDEQGFPVTYKANLRILHEKYPNWIFKSYQTGLDWTTALTKESKVGLNLISKNKTNGWLSYEEKAYNWATDTFIPYDGSTWVTASKEAVAYYMDPRNFLTERALFQFESLEYQREYETEEGVEKILANTPLYQKSFVYADTNGDIKEITYAQAFMEAAKISGVSPYHLASRVKQEVVSGTTTLSGSVTGNFAGYEGYYNFYNIGATHSTSNGGAIANGLSFAQGDSRTSEAGKIEYMLPWDNQYKAIVGGAIYIGKQYINRGQNTIYLEKFNVTPTSTYTHQYMANVEAANAEATKLYNGYIEMLDSMPLVFNIPVYSNMPAKAATTPGSVPNPNNWLKAVKTGSYSLSPSFDSTLGSKKTYTLDLSDTNATSFNLTATPVYSKAAVELRLVVNGKEITLGSGTDVIVPVNAGSSELKLVVTAETGVTNTYTIIIIK